MSRNAVAFEVPDDQRTSTLPAGAYYFMCEWETGADGKAVKTAKPVGIIHGCPCGCGAVSALWFRGRGHGSPEWDVQGDWPKVTLSPSIGCAKDRTSGQFHWHGYLRNGVFEEC